MRLRDFCAGPARTTSHSFFSVEFIKDDVIATFVGGSAATNGAELGRRGSFLWELPNCDIRAERFTDEFGASPLLGAHGSFDLFRHLWRERNGDGLTCSHGNPLLPNKTFSYYDTKRDDVVKQPSGT